MDETGTKSDRPHVLVVDDETLARESLGALLEEEYRVSLAGSASEALEILRRHQPVDVMCTDFQMPGKNGIELIRELANVSPATVGVLVTGFPDLAVARADSDEGFLVVVKPFTPDRVLRVVAQAARFSKIHRAQGRSHEGSGSR